MYSKDHRPGILEIREFPSVPGKHIHQNSGIALTLRDQIVEKRYKFTEFNAALQICVQFIGLKKSEKEIDEITKQ